MFPGVTRQVVISEETHQLLADAAQADNKYIGELADELIRNALRRRDKRFQNGNPAPGVHRLSRVRSPH
jgi:hypothetical protein